MVKIFSNIGNLILLCNLILFIRDYRFQNKAFKIFTFYLGFIFCIQVITSILASYYYHNLFLSHFYFIGQLVFLSLFYKEIFTEPIQKKLVNSTLIVAMVVFALQYILDPQLFFKFNLLEISISSLLLVVFAVIHFYNMLSAKKVFYFINMGVMLYLFGSTVLFLVGNLMPNLSKSLNKIPWIINAILFIIYQILIFIEWKKSSSNKIINAVL